MSKSYAYGRLVIGGTVDGSDTWSCGFAFSGGDFAADSDLLSLCTGFESDVHDWWTGGSPNISNMTSSDTYLDSIRAYYYTASSPVATAQAEYVYPSPPSGANSAVQSVKSACVATLITGQPGRSGKGRMYTPATGAALTSHQFAGGDVNDVASATAGLLSAFNGGGYLAGLAIASVATKTALRNIISVRVDSLPDSQRRRQDKLGALHTGSTTV